MAKKVVYVLPGDMLEIRVCNPVFEMGANAQAWKEGIRPRLILLTVNGSDRITVPYLGLDVFTWPCGRQMLPRENKQEGNMATEFMEFTPELYKEFKAEYEKLKHDKSATFQFHGHEILVGYAHYVLEYLKPKFEGTPVKYDSPQKEAQPHRNWSTGYQGDKE